ncbi:MAG: CHAT domain-containing protein [Jaaginema sp. PMC 1079.18]|nr:CHAT domain-containing protein [Jaaginema sp. PMC 1080.18]MEC4850920.1 CHAT domain-containing protein [Jaaginema sp. PMC 1079.18]MEC4864504.1 CHAT domain-containing protein [Jaaginema sp. PMC 1078.18]
MKYLKWRVLGFFGISLSLALPGQAQITVPSNNDTGTQLQVVGDRVEISGGTFSGDNVNLFHSFEQFNLDRNQIADFLANPTTQNILGRIIGGDPSLINGLIQVSNSNANLYLMNPSGIIFGSGATLNVGGDFFATTATGIGFGNNWFNAFGSNSYDNLIGNPHQFAFDLATTGVIINNGDLQVDAHHNLTLLGGTVINTGNLSAPSGEITLAAIPNSSLVRISHPNNILSLEIELPRNSQGQITNFTALDLPGLLTATPADFNLNLSRNTQGNVQLENTVIPNETGIAIASGNLDVSGITGGRLNVLGNKVAVISGNLDASGENAGGNIRVGGDFQGRGLIPNSVVTVVDENSVLNSNAGQTGDGGRVIVWADRTTLFSGNGTAIGGQSTGNGGFIEVSGKQNLSFTGEVNVTAENGNLGTVLFDPRDIIIGNDTTNDNQLDANIPNAGDPAGSIFANDGGTNTDFRISVTKLGSIGGAIVLQASRNIILTTPLTLTQNATFTAGGDFQGASQDIKLSSNNLQITAGGNITTGNIDTFINGFPSGTLEGGNVELTAGGSITTGDIDTSATAAAFTGSFGTIAGGDVSIKSGGSLVTGIIDTFVSDPNSTSGILTLTGGNVNLEADSKPGNNITFSRINTTVTALNASSPATATGGNVNIEAYGLVRGITADGNNNTIDTRASGGTGSNTNGSVNIQHDGGFGNVPFVVGDTAVASDPSRNGIVGGINSSLTSGSFPVAPNGNTVNPRPNITITSINSPPVVAASPPVVLDTQAGQTSVSFTFDQLLSRVSDADLDITFVANAINAFTISIDAITAEGTLKLVRNNVETILPAGSSLLLQPGDILVYEPGANSTGTINIFRLGANDNAASAVPQFVSISVSRSNSSNSSNISFEPKDIELIDNYPRWNEPIFLDNEPVLSRSGDRLVSVEVEYSEDYANYFDRPLPQVTGLDEAREVLQNIEQATGEKPALIYVTFTPTGVGSQPTSTVKTESSRGIEPEEIWHFSSAGMSEIAQTSNAENHSSNPNDELELLLVTTAENPVRVPIRGVTRAQVQDVAINFRRLVSNPSRPTAYQEPAQQLYEWIITPLKAEMERQGITNIAFILAPGLRSLPMAALYNGEQFLIEQYSMGLMPSLSLTDTRYQDVKNMSILAMGADEFVDLQPLPAVPLELNIIAEQLWPGEALLNAAFTIENLKAARGSTPYGIVHLATHAEFNAGHPENSYIQFWQNTQLSLDRLRELNLNNPPVELLVLSACRTAVGSEGAELGFTGLAVQAGVKSGLGSLWYVSDAGTLALMSRFYEALQTAPIKAEALRQAQLALLRGEARFEQGSLISRGLTISLPPSLVEDSDRALIHPYYWSGFTLIGSPW